MKKTILRLSIPLIILIAAGLYFFSLAGLFRKIDNRLDGKVWQQISIPGAEDITIAPKEQFAIISSDDRAARRDGKEVQGALYYADLKKEQLAPKVLTAGFDRPFFPHGISLLRLDSALYKIYAINHVGEQHSIEVFDLYGDSLVFVESLQHELIFSPNDLVVLDEKRFYFTNDHGYTKGLGKFFEEQLGLAVSNVVYFDGQDYQVVAEKIAYANGINFDEDKKLLYVASPRAFLVKVYEVQDDGSLIFRENIDCNTGVDNIEFDNSGKLWIGCHPNLLAFAAYAAGKKAMAPSEVITIDYRGKGDYDIDQIFMDDGQLVSASTVAAVDGQRVLIGNVMDDKLLVITY